MDEPLSVLLVTANVGSMFEQPGELQENWLRQLYKLIADRRPHLVALHCQEMGGKRYGESGDRVDKFVDVLMTTKVLSQFNHIQCFVDNNFDNQEDFTALGSFYFVHQDVADVAMWDFSGDRFHPVEGRTVYKARNEQPSTHRFHCKVKFPPDFFPPFPLSRKGYMRTRLRLNGRVFDLVNVHLFHDASNLQACEKSPSTFAGYRFRALSHVLDSVSDAFKTSPIFIFGDFNFRLDLHRLLQTHFDHCRRQHTHTDDGKIVRTVFSSPDDGDKVALTLERKLFALTDSLDFGAEYMEVSYHCWFSNLFCSVLCRK